MSQSWDPQPLRAFFEQTMRERGWNISELARAMKTTNSVVGRWMRGESRPSTAKLQDAADGLRVDYDQLLVRAGYRKGLQNPADARYADLCAKLKHITLSDARYRTLNAVLTEWAEQDADVERPTG